MYPWPLRLLYLSTTTPRRRLTPFLTELPPDFDDYYMILRNLASVKRGVDTPSPFVSLSRFSIDYSPSIIRYQGTSKYHPPSHADDSLSRDVISSHSLLSH
jgi:hypothetical protein